MYLLLYIKMCTRVHMIVYLLLYSSPPPAAPLLRLQPLNNAPWLATEFTRILSLPSEPARVAAVYALLNWTDAGPGGFYDDLGVEGLQPHVIKGPGAATDPGFLASILDVTSRMNTQAAEPTNPTDALPPSFPIIPRTWSTLAKSMYDRSVLLSYPDLPPGATYTVTIVYGGRPVGLDNGLLSLMANGLPVHAPLTAPDPMAALTFPVPPAATAAGGTLTLNCTRAWTGSTSGTGCAIAEVWLRRVTTPA